MAKRKADRDLARACDYCRQPLAAHVVDGRFFYCVEAMRVWFPAVFQRFGQGGDTCVLCGEPIVEHWDYAGVSWTIGFGGRTFTVHDERRPRVMKPVGFRCRAL